MDTHNILLVVFTTMLFFNGSLSDMEDTSDTRDTLEIRLMNLKHKRERQLHRLRRSSPREVILSGVDNTDQSQEVHLPVNLRRGADPRSFIIPRNSAENYPEATGNAENYQRFILQAISDNYTLNSGAEAETETDDYSEDQDWYDPEEWAHTWRERQRAKNLRLLMVQRQILRKLHMRIQPNISSTVLSSHQQGHIVETYESNYNYAEDSVEVFNEDIFSKRFKSYVPSCELPNRADSEAWEDPDLLRMHFEPDLPDSLSAPARNNAQVNYTATLRLFKTAMEEDTDTFRQARHIVPNPLEADLGNATVRMTQNHIKICVHKYNRPVKTKKRGRAPEKELVSSSIVDRTFEGWVKLNLTSAVEHWFAKPNKNFGIVITIEDVDGHEINSAATVLNMVDCMNSSSDTLYDIMHDDVTTNSTFNTTIPVLDILTTVKAHQSGSAQSTLEAGIVRQKRSKTNDWLSLQAAHIPGNPPPLSTNDCRMESMWINLEDFGWDWLISPKGFETGYCIGGCKLDAQLNTHATNCHPSKMQGVEVSFIDINEQINTTVLPWMIVTGCECGHVNDQS